MGAIRSLFRGIARGLDVFRKTLHFVLLLFMFGLIIGVFSGDAPPRVPDNAALQLRLSGPLVDQLAGDPLDRAFAQLQGNAAPQTLTRHAVEAIRLAADDDAISVLVLDLHEFAGGGLTKLERVASALEEFKASGKKVLAYGDYFSQNQYFLAAHADEVYMHPSGGIFLDGYARYRTYYKEAIDKLSIDWNVFKVGEYKSFVEPYLRNSMSAADKASSSVWLQQLWSGFQEEVTAARGLTPGSIDRYSATALSKLEDVDGDLARLALEAELVDALWTRDQFGQHVAELASRDEKTGSYARIGLLGYQSANGIGVPQPLAARGDRVAVIVASGQILDGQQPSGSIGGDSMASMIRDARNDSSLRALVLQIDSGGGSKFASEVIQRELQLWKESGRPLVASMSSVAASGGYWIAMEADELWANPHTLTGSIGIGGYFPTFQRTLDRLGIHVDGTGTTRWSGDFRPDRELSDDAAALLQKSIEHGYRQFITGVADTRNMDVQQVDEIARGRVWSGTDARERGLVDRLGGIDDAIRSAASLAGLGENFKVEYREKDLSFQERIAMMFAARATTWFGDVLRPDPRLASIQRLGDALGLDYLQAEIDALTRFNDPRGLYLYCFCQVN